MEADLKARIEKVLSEIFTDKYGEEYGCKIKLRFVPRDDKAQEVARCG